MSVVHLVRLRTAFFMITLKSGIYEVFFLIYISIDVCEYNKSILPLLSFELFFYSCFKNMFFSVGAHTRQQPQRTILQMINCYGFFIACPSDNLSVIL